MLTTARSADPQVQGEKHLVVAAGTDRDEPGQPSVLLEAQ
jgi:hypothetical protein